MARFHLSPRGALIAFVVLSTAAVAQMVWWIIFMARLVDEKVDLAAQYGADSAMIDRLHDQEIGRQIMVGMEGIFFLVLILGGGWLIYRSLVKGEELKFHQQNFLMAVTHELKTPLASIKLYIDTLKSPKIPDEKKAGVLPRMREDLERLEKLVDNILEAGRFERAGYRLHRQTADLGGLVGRRLEGVERIPRLKPLRVRKNLPSGIVVTADTEALSRAFDAVLENSLKYNDKDAVELVVNLETRGRTARLEISDNGIGLSRDHQTAIFDRFYRVGSELSRSHPGSGLGLYLAREIVQAHGGTIVAESDGLGLGSRFVITLKVESGNEDDTVG